MSDIDTTTMTSCNLADSHIHMVTAMSGIDMTTNCNTADSHNQMMTVNAKKKVSERLTKKEYIHSLFDDEILELLPRTSTQMFNLLCDQNAIDVSRVTYETYRKISAPRKNKLIDIGYLPKGNNLIDAINNCNVNIQINFVEDLPKLEEYKGLTNVQHVITSLEELEKLISHFKEEYFSNAAFMNQIIRKIIYANTRLVAFVEKYKISYDYYKKVIEEPNKKHVSVMKLLLNEIKTRA